LLTFSFPSSCLGYTYEYLSPGNFDLPTAQVSNGVFAPTRQAFKAMVIRTLDYLTLPGVQKLSEYAHAGLPIIFDGGVPTRMWSYHKCAAQKVSRIMHDLAKLDNVHVIESPTRNLADYLTSLGIEPLTKVASNGSWYTVWREDTKTNVDYVFVFNEQEDTTTGTVEFASTKIPYWFDAWTGEQTPVALYEQTGARTKIPFTLHGNQSAIVAFLPKAQGPLPAYHATSASDGILSVSTSKTSLSIKAGDQGARLQVKTSDGTIHNVANADSESFDLTGPWNLTVEHWAPPDDLYDAHVQARKFNTTHELPSLASWQDIDGLQNVSGRGYYTTTFPWPPKGRADGAFIDFGRVSHTLTVSINGHQLPPLDTSRARADIGAYLKDGENVVQAIIATTLINTLRPIWDKLEFSATTALKAIPPAQDYGLKIPITVTPYVETLI